MGCFRYDFIYTIFGDTQTRCRSNTITENIIRHSGTRKGLIILFESKQQHTHSLLLRDQYNQGARL